jgi:[protein-PII] uridylyltransferase
VTAQKKDISDPQIVNEFAQLVGDQDHLDYLYVLTVADVRGTNPKLWNNWKASLFAEFYERVKRALRRGPENMIDKEELIAENKTAARELLLASGISNEQIENIWKRFPDRYFMRCAPNEIAWHTELLSKQDEDDDSPLVSIRQVPGRGGTAVITYALQRRFSFARTTALLDQMGINIVDARVIPTSDNHSLNTYHVLEDTNKELSDLGRIRQIETELKTVLSDKDLSLPAVTRRANRQTKLFTTATQINFNDDTDNNRTILELIAGDRPGLLSEIGKVFMEQQVYLHDAKIVTVGERAEDVFYVTDKFGKPLTTQARDELQALLASTLDKKVA